MIYEPILDRIDSVVKKFFSTYPPRLVVGNWPGKEISSFTNKFRINDFNQDILHFYIEDKIRIVNKSFQIIQLVWWVIFCFSFFLFFSSNSKYKFNAFIKVIIHPSLAYVAWRDVSLQKLFKILWYLSINLIDLRLKQSILQFYLADLRNYVRFL